MADLTPLQQAILHEKRENPEASNKEISSRVRCSPSYVSQTLRNHGGWELDQMEGEPVTAEDLDRDYTPPHERSNLGVLIALIILVILWHLWTNGGI